MKKKPIILSRGKRMVAACSLQSQTLTSGLIEADVENQEMTTTELDSKTEGATSPQVPTSNRVIDDERKLHKKDVVYMNDSNMNHLLVRKANENSSQVPETSPIESIMPMDENVPTEVECMIVPMTDSSVNGRNGVAENDMYNLPMNDFNATEKVGKSPLASDTSTPVPEITQNDVIPNCDEAFQRVEDSLCLNDSNEENLDFCSLNADVTCDVPGTSLFEAVSNFQEVPTDSLTVGGSYLNVPIIDCTYTRENEVHENGISHSRASHSSSHVYIVSSNSDDLPDHEQYEAVVVDGVVGAEDALTEFLVFGNGDNKVDKTSEQPSTSVDDTAAARPSIINDDGNTDEEGNDPRDPDYNPEDASDCSPDEFDIAPSGRDNTLGSAEESGANMACDRKRRGRKRIHEEHSRRDIKKLKNSNQTYYNHAGNVVPAKVWRDVQCMCKAECHNRLEVDSCQRIFEEFWNLGSYNAQNLFISASITEKITSQKHLKKEVTRVYRLGSTQVCREMFRKTLQVSTKRINTAVNKFRSGDLKDRRGSTQGGRNKISDTHLEEVKLHINKMPRYKSHYRRRDTDAEFLAVGMTLVKMYELYLEGKFGESSNLLKSWKEEKNKAKKNVMAAQVGGVVSFSSYRRIFLTHFNLKFKSLKKDTCNLCDSLAARLASVTTEEEKRVLENDQNTHHQLWQGARNVMKHDQELAAAKTEELEVLTFDLEKTLPLPRIPTSIVFYKRQLWLYNAGVHSCRNSQGYCYVWTENMAGRGAQEIGSCLMKHIANEVGPEIKHLILWSDSCGGQNRNIKMVLMLKCCLESHPSLETINLKFLVSGHSFLPNDTDFSDIETALSYVQRLYLPEDYISVMKNARKKKPFIVTKMTSQDFKGTQKLEGKITNRKQGASNEKISWLKIREIKLEKKDPFHIYCRPDFESEFSVINVEKKPVRGKKPSHQAKFFEDNLEPMWQNGKAVAVPKLKDLKSLMHLLPKEAKQFYNSLEGSVTVEDDIDGFGVALDFEVDDDDN